jgi:glycosyltransferase involved in cell wall biosynthesis
MTCTVSIIIPAYNAERWIGSALDSALKQTWPHTEIIVVDDGSSDNTFAAANAYECAKVKVIRQENRGAAAARNIAFSKAQGDFIQYLDADDLLSATKVEEQVILLQSNPGFMAVSPARYFFDGQNPDSGPEESSGVVDSDDPVQWLTELLGPDGPFGMVPYGAWLTPHSVAECAGRWDESVRSPDDDGEYFARVVLASRGIRSSKNGRYYYRKLVQGGSYSSTRSEALFWGRLHSLNCKAKWLLARTDHWRARRALANRYMDLAFVSYPYFPGITEQALQRATELGGTSYTPTFGTWRGEFLRFLIGWKATRRTQALIQEAWRRFQCLAL